MEDKPKLNLPSKKKNDKETCMIKTNKIQDLQKMSKNRTSSYIIISVSCLVALILIYHYILTRLIPYSSQVLLLLLCGGFVFSAVFVYTILSVLCSYFNYKFVCIVIQSKSISLTLILSLDISTIMICMWSSLYKDKYKDNTIISLNLLIENIPRIIGLAIFSTLYIFKNITIDLINLHMHKNNYELRLDQDNRSDNLMKLLDKKIGPNLNDDIDKKASKIFKKLSRNEYITKEGLSDSFDPETLELFFDTFNVNHDHVIDKNEFKKTYKKIIKHRYGLLLSLSQKDILLKKFNILLICILVPLGYVVYEICQNPTFDRSSVIKYIQVIVSLNFIFGSLAQDIFKSLNYILVIRIFDVGDILNINNKIHEVKEIGLLYSTFIADSKIVVISNSKLMNYDITNYRLTTKLDKEFLFRGFKINIIDLSRDGLVAKISIGVTFKLNYQNIYLIQKEENEFFFSLVDVFRKIDLKYLG
ncbi:hypothetical protein P3W45_001133 [Vairimorpha bombi]